NEDSNENTFARLTPKGPDGEDLIGASFTYDGLGTPLVFDGTPVDIPMDKLDSLQFNGPEDFKGAVTIQVRAVTIDYDDDDGTPSAPAESGYAELTNVILQPVADEVTLALSGLAKGTEDLPIDLDIRPTSSDPSETFNVRISGIPAGAEIHYDGNSTPLALTGPDVDGTYSVIIEGFDSNADLTITPPPDSNDDFTLRVTAQSVDDPGVPELTPDTSDWADEKTIRVEVEGVADGGSLVLDDL